MAHFLFDFSFSACTKALLREMEGVNFWPTMFGSKFVESDVLHRFCSSSIRQVLGVWAVLWSRPIGRCSISPLSVSFRFVFHIDPCFVHSPNFIGCTVWGTGWGAFDKKEFHQIVVSLTCVLWSLKMTHQEVFFTYSNFLRFFCRFCILWRAIIVYINSFDDWGGCHIQVP